MKNDIYDLLNDIDNQIDTFETVDITSTDLKNWKQSFALKKKTSVKKHTWKKICCCRSCLYYSSWWKQCSGKAERIRTIPTDYGKFIHTFRHQRRP